MQEVQSRPTTITIMNLMPNLTETKEHHGSVAMGNKLYVAAGHETQNCEVFDHMSNKFVRIKPIPPELNSMFETFRVLDKIVVKYDGDEVEENVYVYNPTDDNWTSMRVELFQEKPTKLLYF